MKINLSSHFKRAYQKIPRHIQKDFDAKIAIFIKNLRHPSLKTHKLQGKHQSCLAFRLRDGFRVLFEFPAPNTADLLDIGSRDIYRQRKK
ncbi:hypothetical protein COU00_00330 [Candidatus Falkowbacteria bacterium CG10_big_fil_rev_8_21_14_0_10_43_11]|uniref:Type II toxin-antitoxin system mRNA interferase toxin, RelE/StbE family n=1 Tax=Candidatus Falkowbacteria bacterium CG10_big_fil_rev_8_21_14_0_10_43_11 TaxID=1974568 RepID=A0A2M6WN52_9BACT|nr:MAG: hypothetical protein COU00_00330 [Candidatus Falkowbacteria bacterium CG10_big_fil_rev_8_21_14_0_10_43_11]